jgi:glutathione synthase/RimK-type ligase-like ATP-grasp enzyme
VDQKRLSDIEIEMSVSDYISGHIYIGSQYYDLTEISSAYLRPYSWTSLDNSGTCTSNQNDARCHGAQIEQVLTSWVDITPALVVNRFASMASNGSKPYQASIIKKYGFKTPATIISNTPEEVAEFCNRHGEVIYKSISGVRSIVSRVTREKMKNIDDIIWAPTQFQQYVSGKDIRVHVIGNQTICSEIISNADDYRYAANSGNDVKISACDIPAEYKNKCLELVKDLGLVVGGVDLRLSPDDEWYCFEVNPSPGFTYYQSHTGQDIAGEIADLLIRYSGN